MIPCFYFVPWFWAYKEYKMTMGMSYIILNFKEV